MIDAADVVPFPDTVRKRSRCVGMVPPMVVGQEKRTEEKVCLALFTKDGSLLITDFGAHHLQSFSFSGSDSFHLMPITARSTGCPHTAQPVL